MKKFSLIVVLMLIVLVTAQCAPAAEVDEPVASAEPAEAEPVTGRPVPDKDNLECMW